MTNDSLEDGWHRLIKHRESNVYPKDGEKVLVKIYDYKNDKYHTLEAIFHDYEDFRSWKIKNKNLTCLPEWWKYDR